jgi:hypothetical protein
MGKVERGPMKTVYLVRTHRDPTQILRLVATIKRGSPAARVLVWHDASGAPLDPAPFADLPDIEVFLDREPTRRGGFTMLSGYLRAVERLLAASDFEWLVYLSGQDYPTRPLAESERFLAESGADGFITWWDIRSPESPWGRRKGFRRYHFRYYDPPRWAHPLLRGLRKANDLQKLVHIYTAYGVQVGFRARVPFGRGLACYGGLQWHALSRPCIQYLADFARQRPDVLRHYERTILPDESFLQTALVNGGRFRLVNDDKRYYDFGGSRDGHPRTLGLADLPRITGGAYHFARKLDLARDPELFDRLDEVLGGAAPPGD